MAASERRFILEIFLNGCFSSKMAKIYLLILMVKHTLHFCGVMLKRNDFLLIFLGKGFIEKCKHTQLAINFTRKHFFSKKDIFSLSLVKYQHRESARYCF